MSRSPRASRMATPWSPRFRTPSTLSPGRTPAAASVHRTRVDHTRHRSFTMYMRSHLPRSTTLVSPARITELRHASAALPIAEISASGSSAVQPLLEYECEPSTRRGGLPENGKVVDRAVDRELADGAARKANRPHHEGIRRDRQHAASPTVKKDQASDNCSPAPGSPAARNDQPLDERPARLSRRRRGPS